jgi:hypothetical protein
MQINSTNLPSADLSTSLPSPERREERSRAELICEKFFSIQAQLDEDKNSFPVGKNNKGLIQGKVGRIDQKGQTQTLAKYLEVRHGTGPGPRGILITLSKALGEGTCQYKFSPNPHTESSDYNKNQKELYLEAAKKIIDEYLEHRNNFLQTVSFEAYGSDYTANLVSIS